MKFPVPQFRIVLEVGGALHPGFLNHLIRAADRAAQDARTFLVSQKSWLACHQRQIRAAILRWRLYIAGHGTPGWLVKFCADLASVPVHEFAAVWQPCHGIDALAEVFAKGAIHRISTLRISDEEICEETGLTEAELFEALRRGRTKAEEIVASRRVAHRPHYEELLAYLDERATRLHQRRLQRSLDSGREGIIRAQSLRRVRAELR